MKNKKMMNKKNQSMNQVFTGMRKQAGWTFWSLLFTLGVVGLFAYVGMQLVPVYSGSNNLYNAMKQSVDGKDLRKVTRRNIINDLNKQLYLDGNDELIDLNDKDVLKIRRARGQFTIEAEYVQKVPLFFNLSIAADFNPKLECSLSGQCQ